MIDVLLVVLIIFMTIAHVCSVGLDASLPQNSNSASGRPEAPIILEIAADGTSLVNSVSVQASLLRDRLIDFYRRRGGRQECGISRSGRIYRHGSVSQFDPHRFADELIFEPRQSPRDPVTTAYISSPEERAAWAKAGTMEGT